MYGNACAYAIRQLLHSVIIGIDDFLEPSFFPNCDEKYEVLFEVIIIVISLVFLLMDDDNIDEANYKHASYLPRRVRIELVLNSLMDAVEGNSGNEFAKYCIQIKDVNTVVAEIYSDLRTKINQIRGTVDFDTDGKALEDEAIDVYYKKEILNAWGELREKLALYSMVKEI